MEDKEEKLLKEKQLKARKLIKAINDDKYAEINGRKYTLLNFNHTDREKIFSYYTTVNFLFENNNYSFLDTDKWQEIKLIIFKHTSFESSVLSESHFEKYEGDYILYITTMLAAMAFPFFPESPIN